jgi:amino acid transporter
MVLRFLSPEKHSHSLLAIKMDVEKDTQPRRLDAPLEPQKTFDSLATDDALLAELGHAQELKREFSLWSLGSLCLCLMATWEALGSVLALALLSGGAPCLFYNYVLSFLGTLAIACSLAEISSIYPTAGGQYHWVAALAPPRYRASASWFTGWISVGGQICLTASAAFAGGLQFRGLISLNDQDGSYVPTRWQGMLFYWAILLYSLIVNLIGTKPLALMNSASGILHLAGFFALIITIGALSPKHDAHYVFVEVDNQTGWASDGLAWMIGMLSTVYPFLG